MEMIDITRPIITDMTVWPGDESVLLERTASISEGSMVNVSRIHMGVHTGTHIDAPLHFIDYGKSVDELDICLFSGWVQVLDVKGTHCIEPEQIAQLSDDAVFFKTTYSEKTLNEAFDPNYTGLSPEATRLLLDQGVRVVGTDALSIESFYGNSFPVHQALLGKEVLVIEGLCLKDVSPGRYRYLCMPLLIKGADGSPARVFLLCE